MGHVHQEIYLHLVWATRGREPLLSGEAERRIHRCLQSEAEKLRCVVLAVNGMPDHVHLALRVPTSLCAAQVVKQLKGASSRLATQQLVQQEEILPFFAWQEGYGVFSLSRPHLTQVVTYIQNQKRHHESGKLWQSWETTEAGAEPTGASQLPALRNYRRFAITGIPSRKDVQPQAPQPCISMRGLSGIRRMNTKQLLALWVGIGIAVGMLLFPPYLTAGGHPPIVYRFLLSPPPLVSKDAGGLMGAMVTASEANNFAMVPPAPLDAAVLLAQLGIVGLLTLGLTLTLRGGTTRDTLNGHLFG